MEFTQKQIEDWYAYEAVRQSGVINMFDAYRGAKLAGITEDDYMFCLRNYSKLKMAAEDDEP